MRRTLKNLLPMLSLSLLALTLLLGSACGGAFQRSRRVAVVDFENLTGDPEYRYLEGAVGEYLTTYLANSGAILLRERQDINRKLEEIDNSETESARLQRWRLLGKRIEAEYIVGGSVSRLDHNFIINARLFSVSRGEVLPGSAITDTCKEDYEIYYRVNRVGAYLAAQLKARGALNDGTARPAAAPTAASPSASSVASAASVAAAVPAGADTFVATAPPAIAAAGGEALR